MTNKFSYSSLSFSDCAGNNWRIDRIMFQCRRVQPTAWQGTHIAVHVNLTRITLKDPGAQDGTSSRKERVLHSYTYHACLTSKFRSIVDGIPVFNAGPCALHWPNWCRDMFDVRQQQNLFEKSTRIPICLTVCLSLHQRPVRVVQLRKNQAKSKTLEPSSTSLKYDPRARHVSPALING